MMGRTFEEFWHKDGPALGLLYANDSVDENGSLRFTEIGLLILQSWTLLHAVVTRRLSVWWGVLVFGLWQETIGWVLGTHLHSQFKWHLVEFLPLKEALIYQLILYQSFVAVQRLGITSAWANGVVFAFVNHFANAPYDWMGARSGLEFWTINPDFPLANFQKTNEWHGGNAAVFFSWLCMGFTFGAVSAIALRRNVSPAGMVLALGMSAPLSGILWIPFHVLKLYGCASSHRGGMKRYAAYIFHQPVPGLLQCIRDSSFTDAYIYYIAYACILSLLTTSLSRSGQSRSVWKAHGADTLILGSVVGYYGFLILVLHTFAVEKVDNVMPVLVVWSLSAILVHFACHIAEPDSEVPEEDSQSSKKKAE